MENLSFDINDWSYLLYCLDDSKFCKSKVLFLY